jgi:hypothetical protein
MRFLYCGDSVFSIFATAINVENNRTGSRRGISFRALTILTVMRLLAALLSLLPFQGCKPAAVETKEAGVSASLNYPVILVGQSTVDVRDSEEALVTVNGTSSLSLPERVILDSDGRLFTIVRTTLIGKRKPFFIDLGTSNLRFFVEVKERRKPSWDQIKEMVLDQVKSPVSAWEGDQRAVNRVQSLGNMDDLIAACRETWTWAQ